MRAGAKFLCSHRIGADVDKDVVEAVWIVLTPNPRPRFIIIRIMPLLEKTAQIPHDAQASVKASGIRRGAVGVSGE